MDAKTQQQQQPGHKSTSLPGYGRLPYEKAADNAVATATAAKKKKQPFWSGLFRRNKPTTASPVEVTAAPARSTPVAVAAAQDEGQRPPSETKPERPNRLLLVQPISRALSKDRSPGRPQLFQDTLGPMQSELSTSQSSLGRKERREAILARALARRGGGGGGGSSSDEEMGSHHRSQESLTSSTKSSTARSRSGRTERYLRRRSRSDDYPLLLPPGIESDVSWASSPTSPRPWLVATAFTSANPSPPVTLRKFNNNNNYYSPSMGRAQSAVLTPPNQQPLQQYHVLKVPVMGTPPPPPPRNPLKKSFLLSQVIPPSSPSSQRPTSYSFGDARPHSFQPPPPNNNQKSPHDYQNVDTNGRAIISPVQQRRPLPPVNRHHSAFYPSSSAPVKSPPTFRHPFVETPPNQTTKPLPWLAVKSAGPIKPISSSKDFWKAKDQSTVKSNLSARERLVSPGPLQQQQQHPVRELSRLKPSTDRNLEKAICELEDIYRSLNLAGDEDLLDRAERRDLPTAHQELILRNKLGLAAAESSACSGSEFEGCGGLTSDLDTMLNWSVSGSFESLNTTMNSSFNNGQPARTRAPPRRRSGVPDKVMDDMAVRRLTAAARQSSQTRDHDLAAQSGSYLLLAAASGAPTVDERGSSSGSGQTSEPDVVLDDVAFRQLRTANNLGPKVPDPLPFGIPLGPVALASPSDYLHASVTAEQHALRPLLHPTKYPDLVRDDLAFRNLRKDPNGQHHTVNTDKLDDLLRESSPPSSNGLGNNKKRAVRSLSANIGQLVIQDAARPSGGGGVIDYNRQPDEDEDRYRIDRNPFIENGNTGLDGRAQSLTELNNNNNNKKAAVVFGVRTPRSVKHRSDLKRVTKSCEPERPPLSTSSVVIERQTHPSASWVERAQLMEDEDDNNSSKRSTLRASSSTETLTGRAGALAQLYPSSALLPPSPAKTTTVDLSMDHLISDLSQFAASEGTNTTSGAATLHHWEESPLFKPRPQFVFNNNSEEATASDSASSGQVSCCAREVRQILAASSNPQMLHSQGRNKVSSRKEAEQTTSTAAAADSAAGVLASSSTQQQQQRRSSSSAVGPTGRNRRMSSTSSNNNNNELAQGGGQASAAAAASGGAAQRAERIARYKEERRKQLMQSTGRHQQQQTSSSSTVAAAGAVEREAAGSSSGEEPHEQHPSYAQYKQRKQLKKQQQQQQQQTAAPAPVEVVVDAINSNVTPIKRFIKRDSPSVSTDDGREVRTNRATRLRAAAIAVTPPPPLPTDEKSGGQQQQKQTTATTLVEKDKSTKRKSNLNRALTDELTPVVQPIGGIGGAESQDDAGKRIRRRAKTSELSSAETDLSSSAMEKKQSVTPAARPATDLRANLRKTSQPPSFIRPPPTTESKSPSPAAAVPSLSVPWRKNAAASSGASSTSTSPSAAVVKTEELTARIEALTAIANQTVARVDRLTAPIASIASAVNGSGSVKAVASKLLLNQANTSPLPVIASNINRRPQPASSTPSSVVAVTQAKKQEEEEEEEDKNNQQVPPLPPPADVNKSSNVAAEEPQVTTKTDPPVVIDQPQGILKKGGDVQDDPVSILKRPESSRNGSPIISETLPVTSTDPLNSILKRGSPAAPLEPILKKRSSSSESDAAPVPILKKKSIPNDDEESFTSILKTAVPRISATEQEEEQQQQVSVAERISSMERGTSAAPWRLPTRPGASPTASRRKLSLEQPSTTPPTPPTPLEVVSRHVAGSPSPTLSSSGPVSLLSSANGTTAEVQELSGEESSNNPDKIRGILRRKSSESSADAAGAIRKSILRSKSPQDEARPTKSILKRAEETCSSSDERKEELNQSIGSSSSAGSEDEEEQLVVSAENNLAAKLLNVAEQQELKQQQQANASSSTDAVHRPSATIIVESEGSSCGSGTETTTTVTFRLGGSASSTMSSKTTKTAALIQELGGASSLAASRKRSSSRVAIKKEEKEDEESSSSEAEVQTTVSLRLAALQKSGENDWRKRMGTGPAPADDDQASDSDSKSSTNSKKNLIASRLKVLETAQLGWKSRVHEADAARFTVAGKMGHQQRPLSVHVLSSSPAGGSANSSPAGSPLLDRKKKPLPTTKPVPVVRTADTKPTFNRSTSDPMGTASAKGVNPSSSSSRIVSIPRPDDETFTSFFTASTWSLSSSTSSTQLMTSSSTVSVITEEDFDHISISAPSSGMMVERRMAVSVQRRKKNLSRNPIKSLILRPELWLEEYEEVDTGVAEREVQRIKVEKLQQATNNAHLAVEALAGLAAKEDFAAVALKSAAEQREIDLLASAPHSVYLLAIKGRRQVQTRLVEPVCASVNSGDCYVLVAPAAGHVIQFIGRYSNVIERSKCAEVAQRILAKKDLGCGKASGVQIIDEEKGQGVSGPIGRRFWKALGGDDKVSPLPAGLPEEDELYESAITATNMVYRLENNELLPLEESWGVALQIEMLEPNSILVFDFGCEMFVWSGKMAPLELRKTALELARHQLWDAGYDYTECGINPFAQQSAKSAQRPKWAVLKTVKQHMEPVLFQSKFTDWPHDAGQIIKVKRQESGDEPQQFESIAVTTFDGLVPCDAQQMIDNKPEEPDLELEGCHLGRGVEYYDAEERRLHKVSSLSVKVWHLQDYEKCLLDAESSYGQFHERDTYIIRHEYRVTVTGKDLKGKPSVHGLLGRDRFAYFIWHGTLAPSTDQGASALATVELDEERGPHVRVAQGHEPPAFLALFRGRMIVHCGKRGGGELNGASKWRLFVVRGELEGEAHLVQLAAVGPTALRSRGSLLLVNIATGIVYVWHGAKSLKHTRQVATAAATCLQQNRPPELFPTASSSSSTIVLKEQFEGAESRDFWEGIGHGSRVADRSAYHCLADSSARYDYTPRLYHLTSWSGQFRAEEVAPSCRHPQQPCPYPFLQEDLYGASQPTLFLIDDQDQVWLWQGFWPKEGGPDATENASTGSSKLRWTAERRCAMETVMAYCRLKSSSDPPKAYLVSAGREPLAFTGLFPFWTGDDRVAAPTTYSTTQEEEAEVESIESVLERLKRATYTLSELQVRPPPEGVDPTRLESYLNADDFQETMGMTKADFYALPAWKKLQMRKENGLF